MTDMRDFPKINEAVNAAWPEKPPARTLIAVKELPLNAKVVIEAIAAVKNDGQDSDGPVRGRKRACE